MESSLSACNLCGTPGGIRSVVVLTLFGVVWINRRVDIPYSLPCCEDIASLTLTTSKALNCTRARVGMDEIKEEKKKGKIRTERGLARGVILSCVQVEFQSYQQALQVVQ